MVERSNLHRQVAHSDAAAAAAQPKVASLRAAVARLNPDVRCVAHRERFSAANAMELVRGYTWIADCTDNLATRYLINDACVLAGKPLVSGAAIGFTGQVRVSDKFGKRHPHLPPKHSTRSAAPEDCRG